MEVRGKDPEFLLSTPRRPQPGWNTRSVALQRSDTLNSGVEAGREDVSRDRKEQAIPGTVRAIPGTVLLPHNILLGLQDGTLGCSPYESKAQA